MTRARRDKLIGGLLYLALIGTCAFAFWFFSQGAVHG